jgi:hypothetical protein
MDLNVLLKSQEKEIDYLDTLPPYQRKEYLREVEKARGVEVMMQLKAGLVKLWEEGR